MSLPMPPAARVRAMDAVSAFVAAALAFVVVLVGGYFALAFLVLALAIGLPLVFRGGRRRWVGWGS